MLLPTNCLSVFYYFLGLALKGLCCRLNVFQLIFTRNFTCSKCIHLLCGVIVVNFSEELSLNCNTGTYLLFFH